MSPLPHRVSSAAPFRRVVRRWAPIRACRGWVSPAAMPAPVCARDNGFEKRRAHTDMTHRARRPSGTLIRRLIAVTSCALASWTCSNSKPMRRAETARPLSPARDVTVGDNHTRSRHDRLSRPARGKPCSTGLFRRVNGMRGRRLPICVSQLAENSAAIRASHSGQNPQVRAVLCQATGDGDSGPSLAPNQVLPVSSTSVTVKHSI